MPETERKEHTPIGTASYDNWRAHIAGDPVLGESEHLMYSDALLTGSIPTGLGPYSLLNLVPLDEGAGIVRPVFVLRLSVHLEFSLPVPIALFPSGAIRDFRPFSILTCSGAKWL